MARDDRSGGPDAVFGPIDPYCWIAVIPAVLFAIVLALLGSFLMFGAVLVLVGLVVAFDSWVNRHERDRVPR